MEKTEIQEGLRLFQDGMELLVWGYPFAVIRARKRRLYEEFRDVVKQMAAFLKQDKIEEFADTWKWLIQHEEMQKRS